MWKDNGNSPARTALITGASRGLGYALAQALAQQGWHLIIDARGAEALAAAQAGLRNLPIHRPACLSFEPLGFWAGFRHLQKWIAMLRAEGLLNYLLIFLSWHFVWFGLLAALAGLLLDPQRLGWLGLIWLAVCAAARTSSVLALNRRIFRSLPPTRFAVSVILYELLLVPLLFGIGFFKRTLIWRGRKYRIGKNGKILGI